MKSRRWCVRCEICGRSTHRKSNEEKRDFMAKFPLDEDRCRQWVKAVGKEDLVYVPIEKLHTLKHLCADHFDKKHFNRKKTRLKYFAVPTENLTRDPLPDEILREFPCHISSEPFFDGSVMSHAESLTSEHNYWVKKKDDLLDSLKKRTFGSVERADSFKQQTEGTVGDDHCFDGDINDDTAIGQVRLPPPAFSWQETSLITLDEPQIEDENLSLPESKGDCNVNSTSTKVDDAPMDDSNTAATDYTCNECRHNIAGYTCVKCIDYDLCGACEALMMHPQHYVLRVPGTRPQREVKMILNTLRKNLEFLESQAIDGITHVNCADLVIKKEEDPFEELPIVFVGDQEETNFGGTPEHCEIPNVSNKEQDGEQTERYHTEDNESEHSDNIVFVINNENHVVGEEQNVNDSGSEDWLDESLLDMGDDINGEIIEDNSQTLSHITENLGRANIKVQPHSNYKHNNTFEKTETTTFEKNPSLNTNDVTEKTLSLCSNVKRTNNVTFEVSKRRFRESPRQLNVGVKRNKNGVPWLEDPNTKLETEEHLVSKNIGRKNKLRGYLYTETDVTRFRTMRILSKSGGRKNNEDFINDLSPRLSKENTTASKTHSARNSVVRNRVKLSNFKNTSEHKFRILVPKDGQQPVISNHSVMFPQKRMVVRLEDISKTLLLK